jgi:oxaloacetate decarboxylase gamma subunit
MTILEMLEQSGVLTVMGMGTVFTFLVLLIISLTIMGRIFQRGAGPAASVPRPGAIGGSSAAQAPEQGAVTAAITAAVTEYRKTHN